MKRFASLLLGLCLLTSSAALATTHSNSKQSPSTQAAPASGENSQEAKKPVKKVKVKKDKAAEKAKKEAEKQAKKQKAESKKSESPKP
ncbi:MAG: hypothetical protein M1453_11525 [Acidobacteria bacterium]|nr:hypothetical protein [Acidobacteriota bacterium]MCL5288607.1 hypothetical protein [Acidobacteriota bacterium]